MNSARVADDVLLELSRSISGDLRTWLMENQPESSEDREFWWENLIYRALLGMYRSNAEPSRSQFALLAHEVIQEATHNGLTSRVNGAVRIADLVASYFSEGGRETEMFSADRVVRRNLGLITIPPDVAVERARVWQTLPLEMLGELSDARDLIRSCSTFANRIEDPQLAERLAQWTAVWDDLS